MRTLSSTLLSAQQSKGAKPVIKLVLSKTGAETETYYYDYTNEKRIVHYDRKEISELSYKLTILLDNSDNAFLDKDYKGYTATLSRGFVTSAGDEYDAAPPLFVMNSQLISTPSQRLLYLVCVGAPDRMSAEYASANYNPYYSGGTGSGGSGSTSIEIPDLWGIWGTAAAGGGTISSGATFGFFARLEGLDVSSGYINAGVQFKVNDTGTLYKLTGPGMINGLGFCYTWTMETYYAENTLVIPTADNLNGCCYQATVNGMTDTLEPDWPIPDWTSDPAVYYPTVEDGLQTWRAIGAVVALTFTPALEATITTGVDTITLYSASYTE